MLIKHYHYLSPPLPKKQQKTKTKKNTHANILNTEANDEAKPAGILEYIRGMYHFA